MEKRMTTAEGNRMIADFMAASIREDGTRNHVMQFLIDNDNLQYHTSWDWLKPVIDKIFTYSLAHREQTQPIINTSIVVTIEGAYEQVIQFITWYNTQTHTS